ncbi:MAG: P1 family peptidase [Gemmatimonadota bacterium]|nr:P1 family peptidase [Gemmatimonadota bacterium]
MHVSRPRRMRFLLLLMILGFTLGTLEVPAWMGGHHSLVGVLEVSAQKVPNARALGIPLQGEPGLNNAITDVVGVEVGHTTIIEGQGPLIVGQGPIRTGVTAILPRGRESGDSTFAAWFSLNGNGEMTGTTWIEHSGLLEGPILITNTHSVGVVRDAVIAWQLDRNPSFLWALPVVAETYDGSLNDINGFHVTAEHAFAALDGARSGPVEQGAVGGGTGMRCHGFKGGIGSSSRRVGDYTIGILVQCNQGSRSDLRVAGVPVGEMLPEPSACYADRSIPPELRRSGVRWCDEGEDAAGKMEPIPEGAGSIIIVLATDAPLLPTQIKRLVTRTTMGLARIGGMGYNGSGDIFIGFTTANRSAAAERSTVAGLEMLPNDRLNPFISASVHATEEAILNAMLAAETLTGINGYTVPALPHDRLTEIMQRMFGGFRDLR